MKSIIFSFLLAGFIAKGQNLIALHHQGQVSFSESMDSILYYSSDGDSIYLPVGNFPNLKINKRLCLLGMGYNYDSTYQTGRTVTNILELQKGSDQGSISGIYFQGYPGIKVTGIVNDYKISRCYINGGIFFDSTCSNFIIEENIIGGGHTSGPNSIVNGNNITINNNVIFHSVSANNASIKNNILLKTQKALICTNSSIENNYAIESNPDWCSNCVFRNNAGNGFFNYIGSNGNQGIGNYNGVSNDSFFASFNFYNYYWYEQGAQYYNYNFKLRNGSPFKNAGRDGTEIGIYGGVSPWKDGGLPFNPHFEKVIIAPKTNIDGKLPVKIKVRAQNN